MTGKSDPPTASSGGRDRRTDRLAAYVAGTLTHEEAARFEREAARDPHLAEELYAELQMQAALEAGAEQAAPRAARSGHEAGDRVAEPAAEGETPGRRWWRWPLRLALPAAAVVLIMWLLPDRSLRRGTDLPPVLRGGARVTVAIEPTGTVERFPLAFVWSADPLAARYRFELYDHTSRLRHTLVTTDTLATLPPALQESATAGDPAWRSGYWRVVPIDAGGHELSAPPWQHFEVAATGD